MRIPEGVSKWTAGLAILGAAGLIAYNTTTNLTSGIPDPLYGPAYEQPQQIVRAEIKAGDDLEVMGVVKCNRSDEDILVVGVSNWRKIDNGEVAADPIPHRSGTLVIPANSCTEPRDFKNPTKEFFSPGAWVLEGHDRPETGKGTGVTKGYANEFRIVP